MQTEQVELLGTFGCPACHYALWQPSTKRRTMCCSYRKCDRYGIEFLPPTIEVVRYFPDAVPQIPDLAGNA